PAFNSLLKLKPYLHFNLRFMRSINHVQCAAVYLLVIIHRFPKRPPKVNSLSHSIANDELITAATVIIKRNGVGGKHIVLVRVNARFVAIGVKQNISCRKSKTALHWAERYILVHHKAALRAGGGLIKSYIFHAVGKYKRRRDAVKNMKTIAR